MKHSSSDQPRLWYLSIEVPAEGDASYTHIRGIVGGLSKRGWIVRLWYPSGRPRGVARRLAGILNVQLKVMRFRPRPAVLYVRAHFAALPAVIAAAICNIPIVLEINGLTTDVLSNWPRARTFLPLLTLSAALQLRLCALAIGVTPELAATARRLGAKRAAVVSNGVDTNVFRPGAPTTLALPAAYVSFVGTLATWQGVPALLRATDDEAWPPDVALVVVGDGVLEGAVRAASVRSGRVLYLGRLPQREVAGVVAGSICAASPKSGGDHIASGVRPLKLFEAMGCGVPVVVTDVPGQADIVRAHQCGLVVPPEDPRALAVAVAALARDRQTSAALGGHGRAAAVEEYSWDISAARTSAIVSHVLRS